MKQGVFLRDIAANAEEAIIDIVGVIGWQVEYVRLRDMLRGIPEGVKRVVFDIYSPGGDVWEGNGIIQEIGELGKRCTTEARVQVAASMATLIAVACKERSIASNGRFLIHNAWTATVGDATEHEKAAKTLRDAEDEAAKFYAERTGKSQKAMRELMDEERWLTPKETLDFGFVDKVCDPFKPEDFEAVKQEIVAAGKWPKALVEIPAEPPEPKQEVKPDASATVDGAKGDAVPPPVQPPAPAVVQSSEYQQGYANGLTDGEATGHARAIAEFGEQAEALKKRVAHQESLASKYQAEKDRLIAERAAMQKAHDDRVEKLHKELEDCKARLRNFVNGALSFAPVIETWEQAVAAFGGDYSKAAKAYPLLRQEFNRKASQKGN